MGGFLDVGVKHSLLDLTLLLGELIAPSYFFSCVLNATDQSSLALDAYMFNFVTKSTKSKECLPAVVWEYIILRQGHSTLMWNR